MKERKEILLVNPPSPFLKDQLVMPPLGLMYLQSYLKSKNIDVDIYDLAETDATRVTRTDIPDARIVAFTATTPQYQYVLKAMKYINNENDTIKVIGGAHVSSFLSVHQDMFDVSIIGEGEKALYDIVQREKISNSVIVGNPIIDLDTLPFPDREWNGFEKYHYKFDDIDFTTAMSSRGCPYNCGFCFSIFGNKIRFMSPNKVIEEAKIIQNLGFQGIMYYDDTFIINNQRVIKIVNGLKDIGMKYRCFIRANIASRHLLQKLKDTGCIEVGMGIESGNQHIIDTVNKQITIGQCEKVIGYCHDIGLSIKVFLMVGLPGESQETVEDTIKFLRKNKPDNFDITIYCPFPGTDIWKNKDRYDINFDKKTLDYEKLFYKGRSGNYAAQISTSSLTSEDLERIRDYIDIDIRNEIYE